MKIFLLAFLCLIANSNAEEDEQQKLRGNNRKLEDAIPDAIKINYGKYDLLPSNIIMDFDQNVVGRNPALIFDKPDEPKDDDDDHEAPPNEGKDDPMSDVRQIAKMAGLSMDDATQLLRQQRDFSELVTLLQEHDGFLQSEMPPKPDGEFRIQVKNGKVSSEGQYALRKFANSHPNVQIKVLPSNLSLQDAEDRAERLTKRLEEMEYVQVSYTIDGDQLDLSAKIAPNDESREIGKIPDEQTAKILGLDVEDEDLRNVVLVLVDFDDDDIAEPLHTYGGRQIYGGGFQCTNAFSVISSNGVMGTSTAGHCDGMTTFNAVPPEADYALGAENQHEGGWGDLQWHTTSHIEPAEYYSRPSTRWPVRSIANSVSKGEWVCSYSRMKGARRCDKVFRTSVSVNYSCCPRMNRLVAMEGNFNIPGDSGGPWSFYDKAYGIVSGYKTICNWWIFGCRRRDIWSRVSYLGPSLGVQVRTM